MNWIEGIIKNRLLHESQPSQQIFTYCDICSIDNQRAQAIDINIRNAYENQHNIAYPLNRHGKLRYPEPIQFSIIFEILGGIEYYRTVHKS